MTGGRITVHRAVAVIALGLASALLASCAEQSNVDPDAPIAVHGTALGVDGEALADRPVRLGTSATGADVGFGILTVGLSCIGGGCSGDAFDTTTDSSGAYRFDITGRDTQSTFGEAAAVLVSTSASPAGGMAAGPSVSAQLKIQAADVPLPDLRLVDVRPSLATEGGAVTTSWDATAAAGPYTLSFIDAQGAVVWEVTGSEAEATVDGRVLEAARGVATVATTTADAVEGSDVTITHRSSGAGFVGGFGVAPSVGAPCAALGEAGAATPLPSCPLTDGTTRRGAVPGTVCPEVAGSTTSTACGPLTGVQVELGEPTPTELVVVKGCAGACRVEVVGPDGVVTDVGAVAPRFGTVRFEERPVTAVRVLGSELADLTEVAAWPRVADVAALAPLEDPASVLDLGEGDEVSTPLVVGAVAALVAAAGLFGALISRRRP